jgi:hypothetical protein
MNLHRHLQKLESVVPDVAWTRPPHDEAADKACFKEYIALVDAGATELPPHLRSSPDLGAFRPFIEDIEHME